MKVALVGCGDIASRYAQSIVAEERLVLAGGTDVVAGRAAKLVATHGGVEYPSLEALLADPGVDTVVNLTTPQAHAAVTRAALGVGKHVHTEKPLALGHAEARGLAELAIARGVRLSCSPATLLGEAQQTAWKLVRDGALGEVRMVYAEANWGRIESWHPAPEPLYAAGPVVDVGIYPLTILTAMFGPARRVTAFGTILQPERLRLDGEPFRLDAPDLTVALLELASGTVVRLTATFWVGPGKQRGIEFHGQDASLYLATWGEFDSRLELSTDGESYTPVPLVREAYAGIQWSRPLVDLAQAIEDRRPHRASAEHAVHIVEVLEAIAAASAGGGPIEVRSGFPQPEPLEWAH